MKIKVEIEENGRKVTVEHETEGMLSDVASVVTTAVTAAFDYPVECVLATEEAAFDKDGFVDE